MSRRGRLVPEGPRHLAGGDVEAIPEVGRRDVEHQRAELALVVVVGGPVPHSVGHGVRAEAAAQVAVRCRATFARAALLDDAVGIVVAPKGKLVLAIRVAVASARIVGLEIIADPATLAATTMAIAG